MTLRRVVTLLLLPLAVRAQTVVLRDAGPGEGGAILRDVLARPHAVRLGTGPLELSRDSTFATSLVVLGRPTYLAGTVRGDVVVVGADLFLRPGVDITGRAIAIGGTVAETTRGHVGLGSQSLRDETYTTQVQSDRVELSYESLRMTAAEPLVQLPGVSGLLIPSYDRVDGLSLPVGVTFVLGRHALEIEPTATYRSRLGVVDPGVTVRVRPNEPLHFEGRAARDTRSNDKWIYTDLVNSATTLFVGTDTRNYFRSDIGEGRAFVRMERDAYTLEPFVGGRFERVTSITSIGNVWSLLDRADTLKTLRRNPPVEQGHIGSALIGADFNTIASVVETHLGLEAEQGFSTPFGTSSFTQLTVNGTVQFPTFATQSLRVRVHGVATAGSAVPRARWAYLGGSGTIATLDLLERGGSALLFVENRYLIPIPAIQLPYAGSPTISLRDAFGGAGVGGLGTLQHEVGLGIGLSMLNLDVNTTVSGLQHRTKFGFGISLSM